MAKKLPLLNGIFQAQTMALLRMYALYTEEIDGLDTNLVELAESLMLAHLEEHDRFQDWINNRQHIASMQGWRARVGMNRA